jgi:phosphocarrier protein HPr
MLVSTVTVKNRAGLHTRPAASLVKLAAKYKSEIFLNRDGFSINAKSIIGVMAPMKNKQWRISPSFSVPVSVNYKTLFIISLSPAYP